MFEHAKFVLELIDKLNYNKMKKTIKFLGLGVATFFLFSCGSGKKLLGLEYYQVYQVQPVSEMTQTSTSLVFSDDNCELSYDFWGAGGNVGFMMYNKSDKEVCLNMNQSYYVSNGIAFDYFQNRVFTTSSSNSSSKSSRKTSSSSTSKSSSISGSASGSMIGKVNGNPASGSAGLSLGGSRSKTNTETNTETSTSVKSLTTGVNTIEKEVLCIPSQSARIISEYIVNEKVYEDRKFTKKQMKSTKYSEIESPFVFSNLISYTVEGEETPIKVENKFYISEISNKKKNDMIELLPDKDSEEKKPEKKEYFKNPTPNKFYIKY